MNELPRWQTYLLTTLPRPVVVALILFVNLAVIFLAAFDLGGVIFILTTLIVTMGMYDVFMMTVCTASPLFILYCGATSLNNSLPKREKKEGDK